MKHVVRSTGLLAFATVAAFLGSGVGRDAQANPRPLPFSYIAETLPKDGLEIEQIIDMTPVQTLGPEGERSIPRTTLTTEFEYGITDRLELGLYIQLADEPVPGTEMGLRFDGLKQRLRLRVSDPDTWPVDVTLYGEVAELRNEIELEAKIIIQKRIGKLRLVTNLWGEREFYHSGRREWVLHPTAGAAWEFGPRLNVGLEGWVVKEYEDGGSPPGDNYNTGPLGYLGPTLFAQAGQRGWVSVGAYTRLTDFSREGKVGDYYGRFWLRLIIGIDL